MSDMDPSLRRNAPKLALHVPEPPFRPGDTPDFSSLKVPAAGKSRDRYGQPMTLKLNGKVEPYFENPPQDEGVASEG